MSAQKPEENADLTARLRSPQTVRAAFDEAMRLYAEPLYWQIRRLVQNHDDAIYEGVDVAREFPWRGQVEHVAL